MEVGKTTGAGGTESGAGEKEGVLATLNGEEENGAAPPQGLSTATHATSRASDPFHAAAGALSAWVAADPISVQLLNEIRRVAWSNSTVLIRGESGAGKNLLATLLHYLGPRAEEPLIKMDCAGLPQGLLESELFGCEHGAFRGASHIKRGRLELAGEGTLVLDEVAALSMPLQARLLRALEEKRCDRLGSARSVALGARIVALSSVDLERAVARRSFREDLYYRLNVIPMQVPALRERPGDIVPLAEHFVAALCDIHRKPRMAFGPGVLSALANYSFPDNARELRSLLERAVLSATGSEILLADLPPLVREALQPANGGKKSLEEIERAYIAEVLQHTRGKKTQAAQILGISRKTLLEKRKRYGME